ncbi:MAG: NAD+ synthase [Gammaproteobacteria bacterium]|nr:NAD+ synthase [Gammaproteobacteria bacterium]MDH5800747.1 NAD+ synthase [Gammaproteobacteria bacterium]
MKPRLKIIMAQLNLFVGDITGNTSKIIDAIHDAKSQFGADLVVFPELTITGYPPEDLLHRRTFVKLVQKSLYRICQEVSGIDVVLGYPEQGEDGLYNVAAWVRDGEIVGSYRKHYLPNYSVFDEKRYFLAGTDPLVVNIKGIPVGVTICEDVWFPEPTQKAVRQGAELIVNLNASPFDLHKLHERSSTLMQRVEETGKPIVYVNLVGGQDELVFDGASFVMDAHGLVCNRAPAFEEGLYSAEFELEAVPVPVTDPTYKPLGEVEAVYKALVLGVRDYIEKNRFPGVIMGLSGGIDSALTLAIAVDAIGADRVEAVMMPSRYTSNQSKIDAREEAQALGVEFHELPIEDMFNVTLQTLAGELAGTQADVTEENIQARCRCILLMAISNKKNKMVLTTGNKSEMAVGYATLYGDMAGGFNALKDVPKTLVYKLAEYRNVLGRVIPQSVIHKAPSAELAPDQKDSDSLPDYGELDGILELYIERDKCRDEIVELGYAEATVQRVIDMVNRNEYKRRQAAPGVRITRKAFGRDRRYPITSGYR